MELPHPSCRGALGDAPFAYRGLSFLLSKGLFDNDLNAGFFVAIVI
jgi:hypothetical protein